MPPKAEKKEDVVESLGPKKNDGEQVDASYAKIMAHQCRAVRSGFNFSDLLHTEICLYLDAGLRCCAHLRFFQ